MKKIVIVTALIFSIALAGLQSYVRSDAFSAKIRPYVTEPLTKALGPAVRIGKIKASLVPLYVEVRDAATTPALDRRCIPRRRADRDGDQWQAKV